MSLSGIDDSAVPLTDLDYEPSGTEGNLKMYKFVYIEASLCFALLFALWMLDSSLSVFGIL